TQFLEKFSVIDSFFSSRRRHTRFSRDWSSDVCSSDLVFPTTASLYAHAPVGDTRHAWHGAPPHAGGGRSAQPAQSAWRVHLPPRSEERRVGKGCSTREKQHHQHKERYMKQSEQHEQSQ